MCSNPIKTKDRDGNETEFACRVCDDCIATRKNDWTARAMAEMATAQHAMICNLTYRNKPDGTLPVSAKAFKYKDVQVFLKRIRNAAKKAELHDFELRYICCGERGSQRDRVHWHLILFCSHDFAQFGEWSDFWFKPIDQPRPKRMDHWSLWDHGHIVTDSCDQQSISYVMKYALKDMFNVVKSANTKRHAKAENHGAAMFRMSKKPPIGWRYIEAKLDRLRDLFAVPPTVQIAITRYSGYWWPRGTIRENYLKALAEINLTSRVIKGRDAPGWSTLVASVSGNEKDLELLNVIQEEQETETEFLERLEENARRTAFYQKHAATRARCGSVNLCQACFTALNERETADYHDWRKLQDTQAGYNASNAQQQFAREKRPNPFCLYLEAAEPSFGDSAR